MLFGVFIFTLLINSNVILASDNLFVDEDYILRDPVTNKYSDDWSHLDTPENIQLQKEVQNYFSQKNSEIQSMSKSKIAQSDYEEDLFERMNDFISLLDPDIASVLSQQQSNSISPMSSYDLPNIDGKLVKVYEARLHLAMGNLTPSNLKSALDNST